PPNRSPCQIHRTVGFYHLLKSRRKNRLHNNIIEAQSPGVVSKTKLKHGVRSRSSDNELHIRPTDYADVCLVKKVRPIPSNEELVRSRLARRIRIGRAVQPE